MMELFPPSPELNSGKYYACGVDVCEEGLQFCNTLERRCEYCADHHQDCFTYAQQQDCTQYCQDQWRKTLLDNCTVCESIDCEDVLVYKILSVVLSVLLMITVFVLFLLIIKVKQSRGILKCVILFFIPDQVQQLFKQNKTARQNSLTRNSRGTSYDTVAVEDTENMNGNNGNRDDLTDGIKIQTLTKAKPTVNQNTYQNTSLGTIAPNGVLKHNGESVRRDSLSPGNQAETSSRKTVGTGLEREKPLPDIVNGQTVASTTPPEINVNDMYTTDELDSENEQNPSQMQEETKLLKAYNKSPGTCDSKDLSEVCQSDQNSLITLHGELSTMSSRGGYPGMAHSYNPSTDNGYETTILVKNT